MVNHLSIIYIARINDDDGYKYKLLNYNNLTTSTKWVALAIERARSTTNWRYIFVFVAILSTTTKIWESNRTVNKLPIDSHYFKIVSAKMICYIRFFIDRKSPSKRKKRFYFLTKTKQSDNIFYKKNSFL